MLGGLTKRLLNNIFNDDKADFMSAKIFQHVRFIYVHVRLLQ